MLHAEPTRTKEGEWPQLELWKKMKRTDVKFLQGWWDKAEKEHGTKMIDAESTHFANWQATYLNKWGTVLADGKAQGVIREIASIDPKTHPFVDGMIIERSAKQQKDERASTWHGLGITINKYDGSDFEQSSILASFTVALYQDGIPQATFGCDSNFKEIEWSREDLWHNFLDVHCEDFKA